MTVYGIVHLILLIMISTLSPDGSNTTPPVVPLVVVLWSTSNVASLAQKDQSTQKHKGDISTARVGGGEPVRGWQTMIDIILDWLHAQSSWINGGTERVASVMKIRSDQNSATHYCIPVRSMHTHVWSNIWVSLAPHTRTHTSEIHCTHIHTHMHTHTIGMQYPEP